MRTPVLLSLPLAVAAVVAGLATASRDASVPLPVVTMDEGHEGGEDHEALEDLMYELKGGLKKLSRAMAPETDDQALEILTGMQHAVLNSKALTPSNLEEVPEAKRDEHRADFRKEMLALLTELIAIETDILDGKHDEGMKRVRGPLLEIRNRSHDKFQKE